MRYRITAPERTHSGVVAGVTFHAGQAEVDDSNAAALAYFRRRGYGVDPVEQAKREEPAATVDADPKRPAVNENKAAWVAYVVASGRMTQDEADKATKEELIKASSEENTQ